MAIGDAQAGVGVKVGWEPAWPRVADVAILTVVGAASDAVIEGTVSGRSISFYREGAGWAALVGFDMEVAAGAHPWRIEIREAGRPAKSVRGRVKVGARQFPVQRLTLPTPMVDLDPETERRANEETSILRALYRTVTPERLWRGPFVRPVAADEPGTGFGSRRIINGQPRAPHGGTDYAAPRGTPVVSANDGRVALVGEFFFPGRLVIVDHGLGLYTLYFHLDEAHVEIGDQVGRGQRLGTVGSTGRATGPHLHFGVQVGPSRIDPERIFQIGRPSHGPPKPPDTPERPSITRD